MSARREQVLRYLALPSPRERQLAGVAESELVAYCLQIGYAGTHGEPVAQLYGEDVYVYAGPPVRGVWVGWVGTQPNGQPMRALFGQRTMDVTPPADMEPSSVPPVTVSRLALHVRQRAAAAASQKQDGFYVLSPRAVMQLRLDQPLAPNR